jgi:hypothetical protein
MSADTKKRLAIHVVPADGQWLVRIESNEKAEARYPTKPEAISVAVEMAKRNEPSQVKIHKRDGTFQEVRTYGDDPFPPRG